MGILSKKKKKIAFEIPEPNPVGRPNLEEKELRKNKMRYSLTDSEYLDFSLKKDPSQRDTEFSRDLIIEGLKNRKSKVKGGK